MAASGFGRPVSGFNIAAVSQTVGFTTTNGEFGAPLSDQLWTFGFGAGTPTKIFDSAGDFTLGALITDATGKKLFVTDATDTTPRLVIFDITDPAMPRHTSLETSPMTGLPPRSIGWY